MERPRCRLGCGLSVKRHFWPPILYRGAEYSFYICCLCGTVSLWPTPSPEVMEGMYSSGTHDEPRSKPEEETGRLPYHRRLQLEFFDAARQRIPGPALLDVGCGDGFYLRHGQRAGLQGVGVEFDQTHVTHLQRMWNIEAYGRGAFRQALRGRVFDVIHLGHVLEHAPDPRVLVLDFLPFAHSGTLWLFDGPLENNFSLGRWVIDLGSRLRGRPFQAIVPQHLTCTTNRGQQRFFAELGFVPLRYVVREQAWPLPEHLVVWPLGAAARSLLASLSRALSAVLPTAGNLFHFSGRLTGRQ
jgi:SAM-dependent methyltransferase